MNYDDLNNTYTVSNDERAFKMPYECHCVTDREMMLQRFRESRTINHPWRIRCKGLVFGLLAERGD
jgi:hypothetical protein